MMPIQAVLLITLAVPPPPVPAAPGPEACVALILPSVEGFEGDATATATSIRALFQSYLTGPSLKSMLLDARLASQAVEEARQKDCGKVLTVTVARKQNGGGNKLGALARAAETTAGYIPLPNYGTAVAVGAARGGAEAVASMARSTRAKDEVRLDYHLNLADGAPILPPKSDRAKAKADGEDLLTPLIARASEAIAAAVTKK